MLDRLKDFLRTGLGVSPDVMLVLIGLAVFFITCAIARKPLTWGWAILPALGVSVILESAEIWDQYGLQGLFERDLTAIGEILLRHSRDVLAMTLAPLLIVIVANIWTRVMPA